MDFIVGAAFVTAFFGPLIWFILRQSKRAEFIRQHPLPQGLFKTLQEKHPHLEQKDCDLVARALRQFFLAYLKGGFRRVSMPSQVVDDLWHEFILHTRAYQHFCQQAFGRFLHHTPATALGSLQESGVKQSNEGLRRVWWHACVDENLKPQNASRLPLLFAVDQKLKIEHGFRYALQCENTSAREHARQGDDPATSVGVTVVHCASSFSDVSIDGTTAGFGCSSGDGDGGGCGGD